MSSQFHIPVLAAEVLAGLNPEAGKLYVDGTLGLVLVEQYGDLGGHLRWGDDDQRAKAAELAAESLAGFKERFQLVQPSYADLVTSCHGLGIRQVDGILVDLGVSSLQLDSPERGFSFMADAPLDMRMGSNLKVTAEYLVNSLKKDELADIFYNYGEERQARRIARFIVEARLEGPVKNTRQLAEIVRRAVPAKYHPKKIHVATRVFQALRIAVNREFDNLVKLLTDAPQLLAPGARICVISFHSLEDRIVKQAFKANPEYRVLTRKPVIATPAEIKTNPRSRSAKLRVAERK